jgi:hypothetical protein
MGSMPVEQALLAFRIIDHRLHFELTSPIRNSCPGRELTGWSSPATRASPASAVAPGQSGKRALERRGRLGGAPLFRCACTGPSGRKHLRGPRRDRERRPRAFAGHVHRCAQRMGEMMAAGKWSSGPADA